MEDWKPKTDLGKRVLRKEVTDIDQILDAGEVILEAQITDTLMPGMEDDLLLIGQSKGKFGGGRRRVFRQTQKKTREGNKPQFAAYAVIGNEDGYVGLGYGKARETVPARDKAIRQAKLNIFKIARGSGSWESQVKEPHTVPFRVEGKCGSVKVVLMPAPKGKGLVAEKEIQKILAKAGVKDVWSITYGQTKNKINLIKATEEALKQLTTTKLRPQDVENLSVTFGSADKRKRVVIEAPKQDNKPQPAAKKESKAPANKSEPAKPAPAKESGDSATPLDEVSGVGPSRIKKLEEIGIGSAEKLAKQDPDALAEKSEISEGTAENIIQAAKEATK